MDNIPSTDTTPPPVYLQNPDIRMMFNWFLDRLDDIPSVQRTNSISRVVSPKHFPRLFEPDEPDNDPEQIISRLATIPALVKERPLTARHLSALLFWGDSKVLEGRELWLCDLLGLPQRAIAERMLPVEVTFPPQSPTGVLMLENLIHDIIGYKWWRRRESNEPPYDCRKL